VPPPASVNETAAGTELFCNGWVNTAFIGGLLGMLYIPSWKAAVLMLMLFTLTGSTDGTGAGSFPFLHPIKTQQMSKVADKLFISLRTVESHRLNLSQKLAAKNTAGLVKEAIRRGLID